MSRWSKSKKPYWEESHDEQIDEAEVQRIWNQANATIRDNQQGWQQTVIPDVGSVPIPVPGTPILASQSYQVGDVITTYPAVAGGPIQARNTWVAPPSQVIVGQPIPDPLETIIRQRVDRCFEALIREQNLTIAALQEQIDELWAELRGE